MRLRLRQAELARLRLLLQHSRYAFRWLDLLYLRPRIGVVAKAEVTELAWLSSFYELRLVLQPFVLGSLQHSLVPRNLA